MAKSNDDGCSGPIIALLVSPFLFWLDGWAVSVLWGWFVVPLGIDQIRIAHGAGLSLFVNFLTWRYKKEDTSVEFCISKITSGIIYVLMSVGFGWCIHYFM